MKNNLKLTSYLNVNDKTKFLEKKNENMSSLSCNRKLYLKKKTKSTNYKESKLIRDCIKNKMFYSSKFTIYRMERQSIGERI